MRNNIIHLTSSIIHLNDCEELVKILVTRCKKLNQEVDSKDGVKNEEMEIW